MHYTKKGSRGFTLIEVLVTIGLIGVMIIIYYFVVNSAAMASNVKYKDLALKIATHKIEEVRAMGYAAVPASGSFPDSLLSSLPGGSAGIAVSDYNARVKQVVATVSWTDSGGTTRSVALTTLISQSGGI